jgi:hypothetical protein
VTAVPPPMARFGAASTASVAVDCKDGADGAFKDLYRQRDLRPCRPPQIGPRVAGLSSAGGTPCTVNQPCTVSQPPLLCYERLRAKRQRCELHLDGSVGTILDNDCTEVVWVCKRDEDVDPDWFSQRDTDVMCVVAGQLRDEFKAEQSTPVTLWPGDVLVLPPDTACRAYRWPRDSSQAAVFLAATARSGAAGHSHAERTAQ